MDKNYKVYAQTQTQENYRQDKKITNCQWKIYYYLLSISNYNSQKVEDHRYIYRNKINISQICRDLGIKSTKTFYNAIKRLSTFGLVLENKEKGWYEIYSNTYVKINVSVLRELLKISCKNNKEDQDSDMHIDLLRLYLILKKMHEIAHNSLERSFTRKDLITLLGRDVTTSENYYRINIYLALLSHWNFISLKMHTEYNKNIGSYMVYHLIRADEDNISDDFVLNINSEQEANVMSEEMFEKLKFKYPELLQQAV